MQYNRIAAIASVLALAFVLAAAGPMTKNAFASQGGNNNNNGNQLSANSQSVSTNENAAVAVTLTGNGPSDFTYVVDTQPANGVLSGTAPNLTYTPNTNYDGADSFTFHTHKGNNDSTTATVSITVNNVPLNCDAGFHEENNACVADEVSGGGTGDNGTDTGSGDNGSGSGTGDNGSGSGDNGGSGSSGSGDIGSGSGDTGSGSGTGSNSTDTGSGSGSVSGSGDNGQPPVQPHSSNGRNWSDAEIIADALKGVTIPESTSGLNLYDASQGHLGVHFVEILMSEDLNGVHYTEGQLVYILEHYGELVG